MSQMEGSEAYGLDCWDESGSGAGNPGGGEQAVFAGLDADMRAYAENKGWHKDHNPVGAVLKSYKELESRLGSAVTLPAQGDTEGWNKLYGRLGRPEKAEAYSLPFGEQYDADVAGKVRGMFHTAGLTQSQAEKLFSGYAEMTAPMLRQQAEAEARAADEAAQAAKEVGEQGMGAAKAVFKRFVGENREDAQVMERVLGDGRMIRFFAGLAKAVGEDGKGSLGLGSGGGVREEKSNYLDIVTNAFSKHGS